jgi:hypothetical protein
MKLWLAHNDTVRADLAGAAARRPCPLAAVRKMQEGGKGPAEIARPWAFF